jgi:hypothetical protein
MQDLSVTALSNHRTEVGILTTGSPPNLQPHEIGLTGLLTVLGEHTSPSSTLFSIPSRHRKHEATFSSTFLEPTGLHPNLQLRVSSSKPPLEDSFCAIHAYLTLPKAIFADRYQLGDDLFLTSKNLTKLRYTSLPVDLEAPSYRNDPWGSAVLLELAPPDSKSHGSWTAEIPLHLRYQAPNTDGYTNTEIPYPVVFWACTAEEGTKFPSNPFERVNLGYDALFGPRTVFWHIEPQPKTGSRLLNSVKVPVMATGGSRLVAIGTAVAVGLGFLWVLWSLVAGIAGTSNKADSRQKQDKGGKASKTKDKKTQ